MDELKSSYHYLNVSSHSGIKSINDTSEAVIRMLEKRVSERQAKIRQQVQDAIKERNQLIGIQSNLKGKPQGTSSRKLGVSYESPNASSYRSSRVKNNPPYSSSKRSDVFERLSVDTRRKRDTSKEESMAKSSAGSFLRGNNIPRIEDRLLKFKKDHQNWIAKQRFLKKSKEFNAQSVTRQPSVKPFKSHLEIPLSLVLYYFNGFSRNIKLKNSNVN